MAGLGAEEPRMSDAVSWPYRQQGSLTQDPFEEEMLEALASALEAAWFALFLLSVFFSVFFAV